MSTEQWMRLGMTFAFIVVSMSASALAARRTWPEAWDAWGRRVFVAALVLAAIGVVGWRGRATFGLPVGNAGSFLLLTSIVMTSGVGLLLTIPLWAPLGLVTRAPVDDGSAGAPTIDVGRRAFLRRASAIVPAGAAATGPVGAVAAASPPIIRRVDVPSRTIPPALDGVTVLQLSDVHLGTFIDLAQVQAVVDAVREAPPDLIVLTGDIADDLKLLPDAMALLRSLAPRLGMFACIGNHEVYRGRDKAIGHFVDGGARFLCDDGALVEHNGARLWIGGANDPARLGGEHRPFLARTVERALAGCPDDVTCRIVLSHRPEGFDRAAALGATLTLAGHTHGAQMALFGRSLLEWAAPSSYLLGRYRRGESTLYTSAGLGHWFPFRLNCPCEATLVTLRASSVTTT